MHKTSFNIALQEPVLYSGLGFNELVQTEAGRRSKKRFLLIPSLIFFTLRASILLPSLAAHDNFLHRGNTIYGSGKKQD